MTQAYYKSLFGLKAVTIIDSAWATDGMYKKIEYLIKFNNGKLKIVDSEDIFILTKGDE